MLINLIRTPHPNITVFLLWVIPAVYIRFFGSQRFHRYISYLFFMDGLIGFFLLLLDDNSVWVDAPGYRANFWKPFFNALGLDLKENYLILWGSFTSYMYPSTLASYILAIDKICIN
jgi:hypothetical protein